MVKTYDELKKGMANQSRTRLEAQAGRQGWDWPSLGAIVGLSGGIITALMGSLLTAITWFKDTGTGNSYLHTLGTILLLLTIPLLVCGAHCLDITETRKSKVDIRSPQQR